MKKYILCICLVLVVCTLLLCACSSNDGKARGGSDEIVGTWVHTNNKEYQDILEGYISEDIFFSVYYIFNADGTGSTHINDEKDIFSFEYTYDGETLHLIYESAQEQDLPCTIQGDEMHFTDNGEEVIFYKQ